MRILFANDKRGLFGGVEQCVADSAAGLAARGHSCHLVFRSSTGRSEDRFDQGFESVQACRELGVAPAESPGGLAEVIRRVRPDVVYVHKVESIAPVMALVPRSSVVVRMVHDHDLICPRRHKYDAFTGLTCQRPAGLGCMLDLAFLERSAGSPTGVGFVNVAERLRELARHRSGPRLFVASRYMAQELIRNQCDAARIRVVPPCVDVRGLRASPPPMEPRVLFVGQLIRGKGVDLLLEAFARLDPAYQLDIVGTGNAAPGLVEQARRLGLGSRVTFHGWVDSQRTPTYFDNARIVVVPSRWPEPFGMVGVEAMAHGRAVVAFDVGGIRDWLDHGVTGLVAPEQNVAELASAIDRIHTVPGLAAAMGDSGRSRYEENYRYPHLVRLLEQELEQAAACAVELEVAVG